ncbi:hypothetical protein J6590_035558 [Homalodisca vitripennis]|nr:hypothetical protein J6590_035558 [Homalodisca vitripennis]
MVRRTVRRKERQLERGQERVRKRLFDEIDNDQIDERVDYFSEDDDEEVAVEASEHVSGSEESASDLDEQALGTDHPVPNEVPMPQFTGKDNETKWNMHKTYYRRRTQSHDIVIHLPGPLNDAKQVSNPLEAWQLYFPDSTLDKIVEFTNLWIINRRKNFTRPRDAADTNRAEVKKQL